MQSLYETDTFIDENSNHLVGEEKVVETVDPYIRSSKETPSPLKCKDRISVMELYTVDQQVDQYGQPKKHNPNTNSTIMDSRDNDITIDVPREREGTKEGVRSILGLYEVDQSIQLIKKVKDDAVDAESIKKLYNLDQLVDRGKISPPKSVEKTDKIEIGVPNEAVLRATSALTLSQKDLDGIHQKENMSGIEELYNLDCEVDRRIASNKYEADVDGLSQLYQRDCQIEKMEYQMPVKMSKPRKGNMIQEIDLTLHPDDDIMDTLFAVDLEMDVRNEAKDTKCDIDAIIDLYHVDQWVDKTTYNIESFNVYRDLHLLDLLVDTGGSAKVSIDDFVDPAMKSMMNQYKVVATAQVNASCRGTIDVAELLRINLEVEGLKCDHDMLDVSQLLAVDEEISAMASRSKRKEDVNHIQELHKMDLRIDGRSMVQEIDLTLHPDDDIMDTLFAVDLEMDVRNEAKDTKCDIDAIIDLYHVDQWVDKTTYNIESFNVYRDLHLLDLLVDTGGSAKVSIDDFVDPAMKSMMNQYKVVATAQMNASCRGTIDVVELLRIDLEVEGLKCDHDMLDVSQLLAVDEEISAMASRSKRKEDVNHIQELHKMDLRIDERSMVQEMTLIPDTLAENISSKMIARRVEKGEELIEHIFGISSDRLISGTDLFRTGSET
eukprot:scaffold324_cov212-Chaetoceros_neogracile.AAC.1